MKEVYSNYKFYIFVGIELVIFTVLSYKAGIALIIGLSVAYLALVIDEKKYSMLSLDTNKFTAKRLFVLFMSNISLYVLAFVLVYFFKDVYAIIAMGLALLSPKYFYLVKGIKK